MLADYCNHRPGKDPLIRGFLRVIIINSSTGWIPAVDGVPGGIISTVGHGGIDAAVIQAGKSPGLINYPCQGIGEGWVFHTVENNGAHSHLTYIGFSSALGGYDPREKVNIPAAELPLVLGYTQRFQCLGTGYAVRIEPFGLLESDYGFFCIFSIYPVHLAGIIA